MRGRHDGIGAAGGRSGAPARAAEKVDAFPMVARADRTLDTAWRADVATGSAAGAVSVGTAVRIGRATDAAASTVRPRHAATHAAAPRTSHPVDSPRRV
jgi:hypothetical protein